MTWSNPQQQPTLLRVAALLVARIRFLVLAPLLVCVLTAIIVVLLPPTWASGGSFVPESNGNSQLPSGLSGIASQFGINIGADAGRSPDFYADLLRSRRVLEGVLGSRIASPFGGPDSILVFDLYKIKATTPERRAEEGVKGLRERMTIDVDRRTNVVHFTVEGPTASSARDVAALVLAQLAEFNVTARQSNARLRREFLEGRVAASSADLERAENAIKVFNERNRTWQSSPELQAEERRLERQVTVQQELYTTLRRNYEAVRLEEVNNTPVVTVIEQPEVPGLRLRPRRTMTVLLVGVISLLLSIGIVLAQAAHTRLIAVGDDDYRELRQSVSTLRPGARRTTGT